MSDDYDHDRQREATDEANRLMEDERRQLRKAIVQRRGRSTTPDRPVEVRTVENPEVIVATPDPTEHQGESA